VNHEAIPIWIADYVLAGYGTGAIMAVPAHDERDFAFAKQYELPIRLVVQPTAEWFEKTQSSPEHLTEAYTEAGLAVASGMLDGLDTATAKRTMTEWLQSQGLGQARRNYKLRDWLFSRQRYWGEPFPLLHELGQDGQPNGIIVPLSDNELPLTLPEVTDYKPTGNPEGPLALATEWRRVTRDGKTYLRETNTMPQWAGSCWYFLRYIDPTNAQQFADLEKLRYWLPVDTYIGGAEHAVLHLLYSRFWHKVLFDRGYVPCPEPFQRLVNQGMILGEMTYTDPATGEVVPEEQTEKRKGKTFLIGTETEVVGRAEKMSKSRGNVVNPDDIVREYGADSLRLYEMFMGPLEATKPWSTKSVEGVYRFLSRTWRLMIDDTAETLKLSSAVVDTTPDRETLRQLHRTIQKVTDETTALKFNTAIAAMMEYTNFLTKREQRPKAALEPLVLLLAPYAPHIAEELWMALGHSTTLAYEPWPTHDPELIREDAIEIPVQINGKVKTRLTVPVDLPDDQLETLALADAKVMEAISGKTVKLVKVVPKRLVNIVIG
jgi:leucyl-tRNA synthetase